jgi:hypothetical protein
MVFQLENSSLVKVLPLQSFKVPLLATLTIRGVFLASGSQEFLRVFPSGARLSGLSSPEPEFHMLRKRAYLWIGVETMCGEC